MAILPTLHAKKSVQQRRCVDIQLDVVLVNLQYGDIEDEIREFKEATRCCAMTNREDLDGLRH